MENLLEVSKILQSANFEQRLENCAEINTKHLINKLNYINFQDEAILVTFKHKKYGDIATLQAKPQPCSGDRLDCVWVNASDPLKRLKAYDFLHFTMTDGYKMIVVKPELKGMSNEGISFVLPENGFELNSRKIKRYLCEGISVELIQKSVAYQGRLIDFSAASFRVEISAALSSPFSLINSEAPITATFRKGGELLYSNDCRVLRNSNDKKTREYVLEPLINHVSRFKQREFRSMRLRLSPPPHLVFKHPLTDSFITLAIEDLSGSGFSVEEHYHNSVLAPGLIIPDMEVEFANNSKINCKVQVVYNIPHKTENDNYFIKCGLAILDIDMQGQVVLSGLLHQTTNSKSYVSTRVNMGELWKFFFEAGFIYPEKYALLYTNKARFKETYEKLYMHNPSIARHFVYQDKGIIQGHISMLRVYENTWLYHHHASKTHFNKAGLVVLDQIGRYANDFRQLDSTHMNYIICYYRPDNRFPARVFGGCAKAINDIKGCSVDPLGYFHFEKSSGYPATSLAGLELDKVQCEDLAELKNFYGHISGGLMLDALDLEPDMTDDNLNAEYHRLGFKRERELFALRKDGETKAIIMVMVSDTGINLSNLTNCIHVFIIDEDYVTPEILYSALSSFSPYYEQSEISVLLYPSRYAKMHDIPVNKVYNLWVLDTHFGDQYLKFMNSLLARTNE